jgi:gliding motility-associated-like protein
VTVTDPAPVCSPATIDITVASVTSGSTAGLTFTYWTDAGATAPLASPAALSIGGTYYIKGANAGCSDIKPVTITFNAPPTVAITNPSAVCEPSTIDLTAASVTTGSSAGLTFSYWTNSGGTTSLSSPNSVAAGTYFIKGTNTATGCSDIKSVVVAINPLPLVVATPNSSTICTGSTTNIALSTSNSVPGGVSYAWTSSLLSGNASGFSNNNGSTISQNLSTTTGGIVRYTITPTSVTGSCAGPAASIDVTVSLIPDVAVNTGASTSVVCSGCSTTIVLQNPNNIAGTTFSWTAVANGTVSGQSSGTGSTISQVLTKTSTTGAVKYTITPNTGSCNGIPITFDVRINAAPTANAGPDQPIFLPTNSVVLNGSGVDADGTIVSYTWSKLTGPSTFTLQNALTPTLTVTDLIVGIYVFRLEVKDDDTAIGFDDVTVNVSPKVNLPPVVSAGPDIDLQLPINQVMITGTATDPDGTIKSTTWSQVSGPAATINIVANTIELTNLKEGTYLFRFSATDNGDVTASDDVSIAVAPNNFRFTADRKRFITPNGDGQNDFWVLDSDIAKFASCKLIILQNDGSKVLETTGYQNNWDGTANGKVLPQDVYYYVLECNGVKDSGSITIIR